MEIHTDTMSLLIDLLSLARSQFIILKFKKKNAESVFCLLFHTIEY